MGDADGHDGKWPQRETAAGEYLDELGIVEQAVLVELALHIGESELGAVDRDVELGEDPRETADVVFMPVRKDYPADLRAVLDEIADVGDDDIDAEQLFFGEHEAGVDDEDVVAETQSETIHAELTESAEGYYLQFI
jgi:hypothetical protein